MKKLAMIIFLAIPTTGIAQKYQGMNEADIQKMMQKMEKMQACMEKIDQSKMKSLEQRAQKMEAEVKSLCASGKRDQAQKKAIAFGKDLSSDPTVKSLMKCGEMMKGTLPDIVFADLEKAGADHHVCD